MASQRPNTTNSASRGFTLIEVMVAALLSTLLLLMVASLWSNLARCTQENLASTQLALEARLAIETLRQDLAGYRPGTELGDKNTGKLVGRALIGGDRLLLCFDGSPPNKMADWLAPDAVVQYFLDGDRLQRSDSLASTTTVASGVTQFQITDLGAGLRIELRLRQRDVERPFTLVSQDPL